MKGCSRPAVRAGFAFSTHTSSALLKNHSWDQTSSFRGPGNSSHGSKACSWCVVAQMCPDSLRELSAQRPALCGTPLASDTSGPEIQRDFPKQRRPCIPFSFWRTRFCCSGFLQGSWHVEFVCHSRNLEFLLKGEPRAAEGLGVMSLCACIPF